MTKMKPPKNIYSTPLPWDAVAKGYERTTKHALALFAQEALKHVPVSSGSKILDVACGPGTLSLLVAKKAAHVDALDFSKDMLRLLRRELQIKKISTVRVRHGDGQKLPYEDSSFDAAFSIFGLMFFPDRPKGFSELYRTLKPGGRAAITSWAPIKKSPVMLLMMNAVQQMTPSISAPAKAMRTLEDPEVFREEMIAAGFRNVRILPVTKDFHLTSVKKFWSFMVQGSAPLVVLKKKLGPRLWKEKEILARHYLNQEFKKHRRLTSQAWLGLGRK